MVSQTVVQVSVSVTILTYLSGKCFIHTNYLLSVTLVGPSEQTTYFYNTIPCRHTILTTA